ncbi:spore coat protein U-like protein [Sphingobium sp. B11D3B]|uniref:Csu type fimbrial protein n=1 Tax=Sphingobium sp. B11D3B TaxID=2940575 RepID=UPI002227C425|nr:spore coat U domain-containing protein [Sphingobium sp. B11D3B]MCW2389217.1 spore coat protein U-like protein [Sphingobium sp. B11D3B]
MSMIKRLCCFAIPACAAVTAIPAQACTVGATTTNLGSRSSYTIAASSLTGSGAAGLSCDVVLAALTTHYVGLNITASSFQLTGPGNSSISFSVSSTSGGVALGVGTFYNLSSLSLVSLFSGVNSSIPLYFRTTPTAGLRAGLYKGSLNLRWYYSVCSLGVALCLDYSNSPGFIRPGPFASLNWGSGTAVTVNIELTVENDCIINAPSVDFGSAPIVSAFNPVTRTIQIRCSAGSAYSVGLNNGGNPDNGVRRMKSGNNFLRYEIYKSASSADRWGDQGSARRSSSQADANAGTYDSLTSQSFTYRAEIETSQTAVPVGTYEDTITIDVAF